MSLFAWVPPLTAEDHEVCSTAGDSVENKNGPDGDGWVLIGVGELAGCAYPDGSFQEPLSTWKWARRRDGKPIAWPAVLR